MDYADLTRCLKQALKARKITYRELAGRVGLSESGVKKVLGAKDGSFGRLLTLCDAIDLRFDDLVQQAALPVGEPRLMSAEEQAFFVANPGYYNFLWALGEHDWDAQEVQRVHDLDAASVRRYLMTLQRMGFVEVRGTVVRSGHRGQTGRQMHAELGDRVVRTLQDTLLEHARDRIRGSGHPLPKATECGLGRMRLTPASVADFKGALRETVREFARRARRESALNAPSDLVQVGVLTVMAPCSFDRALTIERLPE